MTILETIPIMAKPSNYVWMIVGGLIACVMFIIIGINLLEEDFFKTGLVFGILAALSCLFFAAGIILTNIEPEIDTGKKQYIIKVDDNISLNKFYEKYKIVEHQKYTDIYTVEDLNDE